MDKETLAGMVLSVVASCAMADTHYQRPDDATIKSKLSAEQYYVTQEKGTEKPYKNAWWDNKKPGIYVDIVTGEPLFSSQDKYDSKTGWPSFTKPLDMNNVELLPDKGWFTVRTEVISKIGRSHLGHVFDDGPPPTHKRWCMNSAALEFIPLDKLQIRGYGQYIPLLKQTVDDKKNPHEPS